MSAREEVENMPWTTIAITSEAKAVLYRWCLTHEPDYYDESDMKKLPDGKWAFRFKLDVAAWLTKQCMQGEEISDAIVRMFSAKQ